MIDNTKFLIDNQAIINRMLQHPDFIVCRSKTNNYHSLRHKKFGVKLSLDFRKILKNGDIIGYRHLELNTSPHYHFNNYQHNGNDFTPENSIKTIINILTYLGIEETEYIELKVCNIEFGLNVIPETEIKTLINGLLFYKKTPFKKVGFPYFKKTDATTYKQIKAYAKGLQFADIPGYGIDTNTFRFEIKSKESKNIKKYGIITVTDLLSFKTYERLGQILLDEWARVLITNLDPDLKDLKPDEVKFVLNAKKNVFWDKMYRVKFSRSKEKYHLILGARNNIHAQIKRLIIDKLFSFQNVTFSTQRTTTYKGKVYFDKRLSQLINLENVTQSQNNNFCLITGLDISMQKEGSFLLSHTGLKYYYAHNRKLFDEVKNKYLSVKWFYTDTETQIKEIAHNIRNKVSNTRIKQQKLYTQQQTNLLTYF